MNNLSSFPQLIFLTIIFLAKYSSSFKGIFNIRCDDLCTQISINGEYLPHSDYFADITYNIVEVPKINYGDTVKITLANDVTIFELCGSLTLQSNLQNYNPITFLFTDSKWRNNWSWDLNREMVFNTVSNCIRARNDPDTHITSIITFKIPSFIDNVDFYLASPLNKYTNEPENSYIIQPLNYIDISYNPSDSLYIVLISLPDKGSLLYSDSTTATKVLTTKEELLFFHNNNLRYRISRSFNNGKQFNYVTSFQYVIVNEEGLIISNVGTVYLPVCNFEGANECEYRPDVFENHPYYPECKPGFYFYLYKNNYCEIESTTKSVYLDTAITPPIFKKCYSTCSQCDYGGNELRHGCKKCASGKYKLQNIENNCVMTNELNLNTFTLSGDVAVSKGQFIYKRKNDNVYVSIEGDSCDSEHPFQLEFTTLCLETCREINYKIYLSYCVSHCPIRYTLYNNEICVESSILERPRDSYVTTSMNKDMFYSTLKYYILIYQELGNNIKGKDFFVQVYKSTQTKHNDNNKHSDVFASNCEEILIEHYRIPKQKGLIVFKMDLMRNDITTSQVEYKYYDTNGNELDTSLCEGMKIDIYYPIMNTTNMNIDIAKQLKEEESIDIYNTNERFYNDMCFHYKYNNKDVIVPRRRIIIYRNISICEEGCVYKYVNYTSMKILCECPFKTAFELSSFQSMKIDNKGWKQFDIRNSILKCTRLLKWRYLYSNIGFIIALIVLGIEIMLICIFICWERRNFINYLFMSNDDNDNNDDLNSNKDLPDEIHIYDKKIFNYVIQDPKQIKCVNNLETGSVSFETDKQNDNHLDLEKDDSLTLQSSAKNHILRNNFHISEDNTDAALKQTSNKNKSNINISNDHIKYNADNNNNNNTKSNLRVFNDQLPKNEIDSQTSLHVFFYALTRQIIFINIIFTKKQIHLYTMLYFIWLSKLEVELLLTSVFLNKYLITDEYNQIEKIPFIIMFLINVVSVILTEIYFRFLLKLSSFIKAIEVINSEKHVQTKASYKQKQVLYAFNRKVVVVVIIVFGLSVFSLIYLSLFCIIYSTNNTNLFINYAFALGFELLFAMMVALVFTFIRNVSLCCDRNNVNNYIIKYIDNLIDIII